MVNSGSHPGGSPGAVGPIETVNDDDLLYDFDVKYVGAMRCARATIPFLKEQGWGRIINISGGNARIGGNLSGGARNVSLVHLTKTLSSQLGRYGITVNCIHPGTTRTERTPDMLADRASQQGISPEEQEKRDFSPDSRQGNAICRMVDASEIGYLTVFLASEKAWAITEPIYRPGQQITFGRMQVTARRITPKRPALATKLLPRGKRERVIKKLRDRGAVYRSYFGCRRSKDFAEGRARCWWHFLES